ncbi:MAG: RNA polymerase sigma factor [Crocinitomicaceae bacterium]|nr:RNA polymerase sigma factor [Crocinitomicaceae bacterium]MBT6029168.1 RNA polymerase sigma factor [Crocinitomicaceae bacterium]MBT6514343.1 RNA polymerase sigma factor [Crocinitomicaceae bacterium]
MTAIEFNFQVSGLQDHLRNFAQSLTLSTDDSKDLVQDTILKAFRYREKFVDPANLKAWLFTIMKNTFINDYRRKKRSNVVAENAVQFQYLNFSDRNANVGGEERMNLQVIKNAINALEDELKSPFEMHVAGYKYKEIAEKLIIPIGTVKSRIFAARKILAAELKEYATY